MIDTWIFMKANSVYNDIEIKCYTFLGMELIKGEFFLCETRHWGIKKWGYKQKKMQMLSDF